MHIKLWAWNKNGKNGIHFLPWRKYRPYTCIRSCTWKQIIYCWNKTFLKLHENLRILGALDVKLRDCHGPRSRKTRGTSSPTITSFFILYEFIEKIAIAPAQNEFLFLRFIDLERNMEMQVLCFLSIKSRWIFTWKLKNWFHGKKKFQFVFFLIYRFWLMCNFCSNFFRWNRLLIVYPTFFFKVLQHNYKRLNLISNGTVCLHRTSGSQHANLSATCIFASPKYRLMG